MSKRQETLIRVATKELQGIRGVESAFIDGRQIYVVAHEHRDVDWGLLIAAEDRIDDQFQGVEVSVRAHQGRGVDSMFPSLRCLFKAESQ
jgi:hypothetical protein